jgi:predicted nucleic acid-binding Zn ribbon protein
MPSTSFPPESERAAPGHAGADVVASRGPCPVCGQAMLGRRTSACSDRCRAALSRRTRAEQLAERDRRVRELLEAAVRVLGVRRGRAQ